LLCWFLSKLRLTLIHQIDSRSKTFRIRWSCRSEFCKIFCTSPERWGFGKKTTFSWFCLETHPMYFYNQKIKQKAKHSGSVPPTSFLRRKKCTYIYVHMYRIECFALSENCFFKKDILTSKIFAEKWSKSLQNMDHNIGHQGSMVWSQKLCRFKKNSVMIQILQKLEVFWTKTRQFFAKFLAKIV
jgi:hypothetical protein